MCSVALYMVISSGGEKVGNFAFFAAQPVTEPLHRNVIENRTDALAYGSFAALHHYNCRDAKSPSQELFGAAHHLSGLAGTRQNQTPDKSVSYNMRPHACGWRHCAAPWGRKSPLGTALRRDCRSPFWSAR